MKKTWKHHTCARCGKRVTSKTSTLCRICLWLIEIRDTDPTCKETNS